MELYELVLELKLLERRLTLYEENQTWLRRKKAYDEKVREGTVVKALRFQPAY